MIDVSDQIDAPGFVNTHPHGWSTAHKTLASNTTLNEYFGRYGEYVTPPMFTSEDLYLGQLAGPYEVLNSGTTTVLDHASHTWSNDTAYAGLNASIHSGARVFWAYSMHDIPTINYTVAEQIPNFREMAGSDIFKDTPTELGLS